MAGREIAMDVPPDPMTEVCARYFEQQNETVAFVRFVQSVTRLSDHFVSTSLRAAEGDEASPTNAAAATLQGYDRLIVETLVARSIDNFLCYITELLALVFRSRPETLRSGGSVRLDFVLAHRTMDELIGALTERRVEELAYAGLRELNEDVGKRLGFALFQDDENFDDVREFVEIRHTIVHNRGLASQTFLQRVGDRGYRLGEPVHPPISSLARRIWTLSNAVVDIEVRASQKWRLPQTVTSAEMNSRLGVSEKAD